MSRQTLRLLLAEDDPSNQFIAATILRVAGYEVVCCENGQAASELLFDRQEQFDGVVSDLLMPLVDGKELARRIRSTPTTRLLPILCVSALTGHDVLKEALEAGYDAYVSKPYSRGELLTTLAAVLNRRRSLNLETSRMV